MKALRNTTLQVEGKVIQPFDSGRIELFEEIDEINSSYVWDSEGDLQLTLKKLQRKVWPILK